MTDKSLTSTAFFIKAHKLHGLIFDGAVFLAGIFLIGSLPTLEDDTPIVRASLFLLLALASQILGAVLKKGPLGRRLAYRNPGKPSNLARLARNVLLLFHFILFTLITLLALAGLGIYDMGSSQSLAREDLWVALALVVGGLTTWTVWWAGRGSSPTQSGPAGFAWLELVGDFFLWISVTIVTQFFWGSLLQLIEPSRGSGLNPNGLILLVAMSWLFAVFYLPSRYLYLVEDFQSRWTWVQVWVAMLPVAWLVVFG